MKIQKRLPFFLLLFMLSGCINGSKQAQFDMNPGSWLGALYIDEGNSIPVRFLIETADTLPLVYLVNGDEQVRQITEKIGSDSLRISSPYFDSYFDVQVNSDFISGEWINRARGAGYRMPFVSSWSGPSNNDSGLDSNYLELKWQAVFSQGTSDEFPAILLLNQKGDEARATFLTETGDYRYLTGNINDNNLLLSTFDGSHAFLFKASYSEDSIYGQYWSGKHWNEPWKAWRNDSFELRDPYTLTGVPNPEQPLEIAFPATNGDLVSTSDPVYAGRPMIIQIMGSWCPNCLDETNYLRKLYPELERKGIKVLSIAFEKHDSVDAMYVLDRYKAARKLPWEILYGGGSSKKKASQKLPRLEHVFSYPTLVFLRPDHTVFKTHTGFYGPATGKYYTDQTRELENIIAELARLSKK